MRTASFLSIAGVVFSFQSFAVPRTLLLPTTPLALQGLVAPGATLGVRRRRLRGAGSR